MMIRKKVLRPVAFNAMCKYCTIQERSHLEVRSKLKALGYTGEHADSIIADLITDGFLNEERFAIAYASGKFRINKWGKIKIRIGLRQKKVSDYCIDKAIALIDDEEYLSTVRELVSKKMIQLGDSGQSRQKMYRYLAGKGFEHEVIQNALDHIQS